MTGWIAALALAIVAAAVGAVFGASRERRGAAEKLDAIRDELSRRLNEVFSLQELSYVLSESVQPERIAEQIANYVFRFLEVDGVLVGLTTDGGGTIRVPAAVGSLAGLLGRELGEAEGGLLSAAMGGERMELAERDGEHQPELVAGVPVERAAVLPLRAHGVTVGALAVINRPGTAFTADDLRLLSTVATHAAIVLSNARFFDLVRAGRDQWETTFNALAEGIAVVDDTGCIRRTNRALADLVQVSVPALTGQNLAEALFGDATTLAEFLDAAQRGEPAPLSRRSTPLQRLLRITAAPMRGTGQEHWVVALVNDITEQRAMEAQLIQSEKMAAVGQLVSGVAHELNNPLTSIAGLAEFLLEQGAPTERDRDHMKVIREQADRAGRIVRNLLTFARKGPADLGAILLNDIVQRTVALVGYEIRLREIQLETDYQASLAPIQGDRYQIQQVVVNLVTNAVHSVEANPPERPRRILIRTEADEEHVTLRVADTGRGVPADVAAQIFTPFFTTKEPGEGTGLGLSISYRIVEGHGGTLGVEAGEDGGAVFVMRLPVGAPSPDDAPATDALPSEPATISEPVPPRAPRRTVLLVDDDPAVRRMIGVLLSNEEQSVEAARDAAHAISLLEQRQFDVIIADPRAAVSAGERFAEHLLRRWPDARHRTILVTADVRPETEAWLKELGCRYFVKPFRIGELKTATAEVLGGATTN